VRVRWNAQAITSSEISAMAILRESSLSFSSVSPAIVMRSSDGPW
jgi:hypothetical protein